MAKNLNKNTVYRASKSKEEDYTINDGEGLLLLVKTNGPKLWCFIYRLDGKQNRLSFGSYPDTLFENSRRKAEKARVTSLMKSIQAGSGSKLTTTTSASMQA